MVSDLNFSNIWKAGNFKLFFSFSYNSTSVIASDGELIVLLSKSKKCVATTF